MRITRSLTIAVSLLASMSFLSADEGVRNEPGGRIRHFVLSPSHTLSSAELEALREDGIVFERNLTQGRYLVRATSSASQSAEGRNLGAIEPLTADQKIYPSAYRQGARGISRARFTILFHDEVTLDEARNAVAAAGGELESPFLTEFGVVKLLTVRMPSSSLQTIAADDRVLAVSGPPLKPRADNSIAATTSHVTPLFSAPYNLSGSGVVLSLFEIGRPDTTHVEFGGRVTSHLSSGSVDSHATHVSGTIGAQGINPRAKGMAPSATIHLFGVPNDPTPLFNDKQNTVPALGSVADNNSWGFVLGWQEGNPPIWNGGYEYIGGYDGTYSVNIDKIARSSTTLYVHSAGNDGGEGRPDLVLSNFSQHSHTDENGDIINGEVFCYSKNGSGTDCPVPQCTSGISTKDPGVAHCETTQHPTYGPFGTMGLLASAKNVVAVGALDVSSTGTVFGIAGFSSRGPTKDGRVKPDIVAKGTNQFSTVPNNSYANNQGTSMSSPVVTGISGLLVEQWRKTFGTSPTPQQVKTLIVAGADDIGIPGPDYTMGFGLINAQASVDLVIADAAAGNRIRNGSLSQDGQTLEYPFTLSSTQSNLRVVLAWSDPEVLNLGPDDFASKSLVNDLDVSLIGPNGTTLPYVLDPANPLTSATTGVNTRDNVEEIELKNAAAGSYRVVVKASKLGDKSKAQDYVMIVNAPLAAPCTDSFEPNDSTSAAYGDVPNNAMYTAKFCTQSDIDFFKYVVSAAGTVRVTVTATDTPLTIAEYNASGTLLQTVNVAAGQTGTLTKVYSTNPNAREFISIAPTGTIGSSASYTVTFSYPFSTPAHRRPVRH